jgi:single-strand DNA-binding protein
MASVNRVMLMGRLTRDPVVRRINESVDVADFGLACSESYAGKDGERKERTTFIDINVWDRQASACGEHLRKGMQVFVEGRLQMDEWTDKQSGEKRHKLKVRADRVHFLGAPRVAQGGGSRDRDEADGVPPQRGTERPPDRGARGRPMSRAAA